MSAFPDSDIGGIVVRSRGFTRAQFAAVATAVAVLGLSAVWPAVFSLWTLWTTDALKSIGMMVPPVSLILTLRTWRSLDWQVDGTWWGLPLLLLAIVAVWTQQRAVLLLVVSPQWATVLPPPSLVLLAYGAGVVLLIGGVRLFRAALFPILLLWFANPVPHIFSLLVDLPLQTLSAHTARSFAMHLGQTLTPDHLRLMFTPEFGMFIAPGCNGIRGSVTMGFIALIAGYVYRFRWYTNALFVMAAVLLGYLFNLLRLCLLVLYYLVALHFTSLQDKAENADYVIGAGLFLIATILLLRVIHRFRDARIASASQVSPVTEPSGSSAPERNLRYAQLATLGMIALFGSVGLARAAVALHLSSANANAELPRFPARLGTYTLVRSWQETLITGPIIYLWAQYAPAEGSTPIAVGVAPVMGWHDPLLCHTLRGDHPLWQGPLTITTADSVPINFSSAFYSDGVIQYVEASTQCSGDSCGEYATERTHLGLVYSHPDPRTLLSPNGQHAVPVLIRAETANMSLPADVARQRLTADLRTFLASVKLEDLTHR